MKYNNKNMISRIKYSVSWISDMIRDSFLFRILLSLCYRGWSMNLKHIFNLNHSLLYTVLYIPTTRSKLSARI